MLPPFKKVELYEPVIRYLARASANYRLNKVVNAASFTLTLSFLIVYAPSGARLF